MLMQRISSAPAAAANAAPVAGSVPGLKATPALALGEWKKSQLHNSIILNDGMFRTMPWDEVGVAIAGGMFVVPLYAFLTTTVAKSQTARTIAANNIVNSLFMVIASLILSGLISMGWTIDDTLLMVAVACAISAWIAWRLHKACD